MSASASVSDVRSRETLTDGTWRATLEGVVSDVYLNPTLPGGNGNAWGKLTDDTGTIEVCFSHLVVAWARDHHAESGARIRVEGYLTPERAAPESRWLVIEAVEDPQ